MKNINFFTKKPFWTLLVINVFLCVFLSLKAAEQRETFLKEVSPVDNVGAYALNSLVDKPFKLIKSPSKDIFYLREHFDQHAFTYNRLALYRPSDDALPLISLEVIVKAYNGEQSFSAPVAVYELSFNGYIPPEIRRAVMGISHDPYGLEDYFHYWQDFKWISRNLLSAKMSMFNDVEIEVIFHISFLPDFTLDEILDAKKMTRNQVFEVLGREVSLFVKFMCVKKITYSEKFKDGYELNGKFFKRVNMKPIIYEDIVECET